MPMICDTNSPGLSSGRLSAYALTSAGSLQPRLCQDVLLSLLSFRWGSGNVSLKSDTRFWFRGSKPEGTRWTMSLRHPIGFSNASSERVRF